MSLGCVRGMCQFICPFRVVMLLKVSQFPSLRFKSPCLKEGIVTCAPTGLLKRLNAVTAGHWNFFWGLDHTINGSPCLPKGPASPTTRTGGVYLSEQQCGEGTPVMENGCTYREGEVGQFHKKQVI